MDIKNFTSLLIVNLIQYHDDVFVDINFIFCIFIHIKGGVEGGINDQPKNQKIN